MKIQWKDSPSFYAAFDVFPSAKGASTHIAEFADCLFSTFKGGTLTVLGNEELPMYQWEEEDSIEIFRKPSSYVSMGRGRFYRNI